MSSCNTALSRWFEADTSDPSQQPRLRGPSAASWNPGAQLSLFMAPSRTPSEHWPCRRLTLMCGLLCGAHLPNYSERLCAGPACVPARNELRSNAWPTTSRLSVLPVSEWQGPLTPAGAGRASLCLLLPPAAASSSSRLLGSASLQPWEACPSVLLCASSRGWHARVGSRAGGTRPCNCFAKTPLASPEHVIDLTTLGTCRSPSCHGHPPGELD